MPRTDHVEDSARSRIWRLGDRGVYLEAPEQSQALHILLPGRFIVDQTITCPSAMTLSQEGAVVVTSNVIPILWRINPDTFVVTSHPLTLTSHADREVGFTGIAFSTGHSAYFAVSSVHGTLWRIDMNLQTAHLVGLPHRLEEPCGIAVISPKRQARAIGMAQELLCVQTASGEFTLQLSLDQQSAWFEGQACKSYRSAGSGVR